MSRAGMVLLSVLVLILLTFLILGLTWPQVWSGTEGAARFAFHQRAVAAVDRRLVELTSGMSPAELDSMPAGARAPLPPSSGPLGLTLSGELLRIGSNLWLATVRGVGPPGRYGAASYRIGVLLRVDSLPTDTMARVVPTRRGWVALPDSG